MGGRIIKGIEWLLMEFEARLVTFMIWLCWICGITSDDVERARDQKKGKTGPSTMTNNPTMTEHPTMTDNPQVPAEPRRPSSST